MGIILIFHHHKTNEKNKDQIEPNITMNFKPY